MSLKWRRVKQWDDQNLRGWLLPVKFVLRAFSSITLAVIVLSCVALFAVLASVPVGLLALGPTYVIYGLTLVLTAGVVAGVPALVAWRAMGKASRPARFSAVFSTGVVMAVVGAGLWGLLLWPRLEYQPATGDGFRLWAGFVDQYRAVTVRRLPMFEMSELEFYSWWPMRVLLLTFVVNMIVATVRRIEFCFVNIGVLTVHTGIVLIALGSVYYTSGKLEGDMLLRAGPPGIDGLPTTGPMEGRFYDNTAVALHLSMDGQWWEQRVLRGVPRYNEYNIAAAGESARMPTVGDGVTPRELSLDVPPSRSGRVDDDLRFRIVGYVPFAEPMQDWAPFDASRMRAAAPGLRLNPMRFLELAMEVPGGEGREAIRRSFRFFMLPMMASHRVSDNGLFGIEYTRGMPEARWRDLTEVIGGAQEPIEHALVIEMPGAEGAPGFRGVFPVRVGTEVAVGDSGYRVRVDQLEPHEPFPIITPGYEGGTSSVAILHVMQPDGVSYARWVYHRFPEISQDLLDAVNAQGMPQRRPADPAISIRYLDMSREAQAYVDEREDGSVRAILRVRGGELRVMDNIEPGGVIGEIVPGATLRLSDRWEHAVGIETPRIIPEHQRERNDVGTHGRAMVAVEIASRPLGQSEAVWKRTVWIPFTKYLMQGLGTERWVDLPDGRRVMMAFGRQWHGLPGFRLQLVDFEMLPYPHSEDIPRDYRSRLRVLLESGETFEHDASLNAPLLAPFMWSEDRGVFGNVFGRIVSALTPRQFKFSQAGWDAEGWRQTRELAKQGQLPRPMATFTILGVGNNPGIHVIALGGVLMSVGIPWAFYVKPAILRMRKRKIQRELADGSRPMGRDAKAASADNGEVARDSVVARGAVT